MVAEPGQIGSVSLNPANLFREQGGEILLSHSLWIQDVQTEYFSAGYPLSFGTIGLSVLSSNVANIEIRDTPGQPLGTFSARSTFLQTSYASKADTRLRFGVSGKLLYEKLYVEESIGYAFDAGVLYEPSIPGLVVGASVSNLGGMSTLVGQRSELPVQTRLGLSYRFGFENLDITVASQYTTGNKTLKNNAQVGMEINYLQMFALRMGYQTGYDARAFSAGFGVRYEWMKFDYAYIPFSFNLGNAQLFTVGFSL